MLKKKKEKLGQKRSEFNKTLFVHYFCIFATVAFIVATILFLCIEIEQLFFSENEHFTLKRAINSSGDAVTSQVLEETNISPGKQNLFSVDIAQVRLKLRKNTLIKDVTIIRRLPDTLMIDIMTRIPVAQLLRAGGKTVDAYGYVMAPGKTQDLPIIIGIRGIIDKKIGDKIEEKTLKDALTFLQFRKQIPLAEKALRIRRITCHEKEGYLSVDLLLNLSYGIPGGAILKLPVKGMKLALIKAAESLEIRSLSGQISCVIDCRFLRIYITSTRAP